jgi:hypothetical protein
VAHDDFCEDDFDASSQLAILRRAVAEIVLPGKVSPSRLAAVRTELRRFCSLAELLFGQLGAGPLAATAGELGARLGRRLPNRAELEHVRGELYGCLVHASRVLLALEPEPESAGGALSMRALLSDFHGSLLPRTDGADVWALTVAAAELSLLLEEPALAEAPARERTRLVALGARTERWSAGGRSADTASELYAEVTSSVDLLGSLSDRADVRRHDERVLHELVLLLARDEHDLDVAVGAAERLSALRGLDPELDRLIVDLPLAPAVTLKRIARRVRELCRGSLAS